MISVRSFCILISAFLSQFIFEGLILSFDLFLPYFVRYFHASNALVTVMASVVQGPAMLLGPLSSWLTARIGERALIMICGVLCAVGFVCGAFGTALWHVILASALIGMSIGLASVPPVTAASFHFRSRNRNVFTALGTTGGAVGAACFPLFLELGLDTLPWQHVFVYTACITLQVVVFGALLRLDKTNLDPNPNLMIPSLDQLDLDPATLEAELQAGVQPLYKRVSLYCFLVACFLWNTSLYMFDIIPLRLDKEGYDSGHIAYLFTFQAVAYIPGRLISTAAVAWKKLDKVLMFSLTLLLQSACVLLSSLESQTFTTYAIYCVTLGLGYGMSTALLPAVVIHLVGLHRLNFVYGLQLFAGGIAGFLGAPFAGWLTDISENSFTIPYTVAGVLGASSTIFLLPYHWPFTKLNKN